MMTKKLEWGREGDRGGGNVRGQCERVGAGGNTRVLLHVLLGNVRGWAREGSRFTQNLNPEPWARSLNS